jgi:subtilisin family serine protease
MRTRIIASTLLAAAVGFAGDCLAASPGDGGTVPLLVKSRVPLTPDVAAAIGAHAAHVTFVWPEIDAMAVNVSPAKIADLASDPRVALIEADQQGHAPGSNIVGDGGMSAPAGLIPIPEISSPITTWNLDMADVTGTGFTGSGVTVAVIDSGLPQNWEQFLPPGSVDTEHAAGFGAEGWGDFHNPVNAVTGVGGYIGLFTHGLAVSSVIVGFPTPVGPIGGAAPGATILPVRVLNQFNFGWFSWFAAAFMYVGGLKADGTLAGPVVINFSIQARNNSAILASAIDYALSQGVLFVTIAGNFGPDPGSISFPGRLPQSITAGAVGWTKEFCEPSCPAPWFFGDVPEDASQVYVAGFSGRESDPPPAPTAVDVLDPGSLVFGEWLYGPGFSEGHENAFAAVTYFIGGTSFAAPHVAGIVAQMLQKSPGLSQAQAEAILRSSALFIAPSPGVITPLGSVPAWGANATGSGLARGASAVAATP